MINSDKFIMLKSVDKSVLFDGFNISAETQELFYAMLGHRLEHGESKRITLVIDGESFEVALNNINFDQSKYPNHPDLLQIRYSKQSPIAIKLRQVFYSTTNFITSANIQPRKHIVIPAEQKEQFALYATPIKDTFYVETLCANEQVADLSSMMTEEDFELNPTEWIDPKSTIEERQRLIKVRVLDRSVCDNLKKLYDYRCQITGEYIGKEFGGSVVEAHHIDYFVNSRNNDASNIIIISPNFHRIIHKFKPSFNRSKLEFEFSNGQTEQVTLNKHLSNR